MDSVVPFTPFVTAHYQHCSFWWSNCFRGPRSLSSKDLTDQSPRWPGSSLTWVLADLSPHWPTYSLTQVLADWTLCWPESLLTRVLPDWSPHWPGPRWPGSSLTRVLTDRGPRWPESSLTRVLAAFWSKTWSRLSLSGPVSGANVLGTLVTLWAVVLTTPSGLWVSGCQGRDHCSLSGQSWTISILTSAPVQVQASLAPESQLGSPSLSGDSSRLMSFVSLSLGTNGIILRILHCHFYQQTTKEDSRFLCSHYRR
jgi:hypothetical protein